MSAPYYADDRVTLYLGDCREVPEWLSGDVLVTDPPYGVSYVEGIGGGRRLRPGKPKVIAGDESPALRDQVLAAWGDRPAAVFGSWKVDRPRCRRVLVWDKTDGIGPGMGDLAEAFGSSHEEIYILGKWPVRDGIPRQGSVIRTIGDMRPLTLEFGHPTPKPVSLMERLVAVAPMGVIADPFAGSGSTLVAARNLGRKAIGVELHEPYAETIAKRLAQDCLDFGESA